jgi:hypothetical protein
MSITTCDPLFFTIAWFGTLMVYYDHVLLLILTLIFGSPMLIQFHIGQVINLIMAFFLYWSFGHYFHYECLIQGKVSGLIGGISEDGHYVSPISFPAIEIQILYFSFTYLIMAYYKGEWHINTFNKHVYYRFLFLMTLLMTSVSIFYLWFYTPLQCIASIVFGSGIAWIWYKLVHRFMRRIPWIVNQYTPRGGGSNESLPSQMDSTLLVNTNTSQESTRRGDEEEISFSELKTQ